MLCIKKEVKTNNALFRIGAVVLNTDDSDKDDFKPICSNNDFMLHFVAKEQKGVTIGKKHFRTIEEAEAYIY